MNLFDKNNWLNLILGLFGFYFVYSISGLVIKEYGIQVVSSTTHLTASYHWLVAFVIALVLSLTLIVIFCKPRSPWFTALAILLGAVLVMFPSLFRAIVNLDGSFRREGVIAGYTLVPHLVVLLGAAIGYLTAALSNKGAKGK
jgi:hypothetical protein